MLIWKDAKFKGNLSPRPHQQHVEATCRIRHVEATCRKLLRHVECCRSTCCRFWQHVERFFHPFDMSKEIEHVQFVSTCRTNGQQVAVEEAGVDGFVDMSNVHQYSYHVCSCQLLLIYCSRDPSIGGVKHKRGSRIQWFWTYRMLYLGNGAR